MSISSKSQENFRQVLIESGRLTNEQLAAEKAGEKADNLRWDLNAAVFAYGVLAAVII